MLQPRGQPVAGQITQLGGQGQHHLRLGANHRHARQNAGHGGGDDIGYPQGGTEQAGPVEQARGHQHANLRVDVLIQPQMAVGGGQGKIGAAGMVDAGKIGMGDDVEALLAAVIWMGAPADVRQQTAGVAQPRFVRHLLQMGRLHEGIGPQAEVLAVARRTRAQQVQLARRDQQRVLPAGGFVEALIEPPLAHTQHRHHHLFGSAPADYLFQHHSAKSQQGAAGSGNRPDGHQCFGIHPLDQAGEIHRIARRDDVIMHDMQRIIALAHV